MSRQIYNGYYSNKNREGEDAANVDGIAKLEWWRGKMDLFYALVILNQPDVDVKSSSSISICLYLFL